MNKPKEKVYDEQIAPLMQQIIDICNANKINMAADFGLDDDPETGVLWCSTVITTADPDCKQSVERMIKLYRIMKPQPTFAAFTIIGGKPLTP